MIIALALLAIQGPMSGWQFVRPGILSGIGGMALVSQSGDQAKFLIVHDNKAEKQARVAFVTLMRGSVPQYQEISWVGSAPPVDLEYLSAIPGQANTFLAGTSSGQVTIIILAETSVSVKSGFNLPEMPPNSNFEGACVQTVGSKTLMIWGHRGSNPDLGKLFWSEFNLESHRPEGTVHKADVHVPWPAAVGARGVSDIKADPSGTIFMTATVDAGDDGPFQSAMYVAGNLYSDGKGWIFRESNGTRLLWTDQHKIEAMELVPGKSGGLVFGTDDENLGGYVWSNLWP